jgi:hypothetical protein
MYEHRVSRAIDSLLEPPRTAFWAPTHDLGVRLFEARDERGTIWEIADADAEEISIPNQRERT